MNAGAAPPSAPQLAAEGHLYQELAAGPSDGAFVRALLLAWLGLAAATAVAAVLLDPVGAFGTGLVPPVVWRDRDEKADLFLRYEPKPAVVLAGSSHMMKMRPAQVTALTGLRAFNFAVSAARVEDYLAVFRFAAAGGRGALRRLVLGVDPEAFHDAEEQGRLLLASRRLRGHAPGRPPRTWGGLGEDLLSGPVALACARSVGAAVAGSARADRIKSFEADGLIRYLRWEPEAAAGTLTLADNVRGTVQDYRRRYRDFAALDPRRLAVFRTLLGEARAGGVAVDTFIPPLHPHVVRALRGVRAHGRRSEETTTLLRSLEAEGLLRHHELGDLEAFGGDPAAFFDGEHMQETNTDRLLEALLKGGERP